MSTRGYTTCAASRYMEACILEYWVSGYTVLDITKLCGRSHATIYKRIRALQQKGLIRNTLQDRRMDKKRSNRGGIVDLWNMGYDIKQIAATCHKDYSTVRRTLLQLHDDGVITYKTTKERWSNEDTTELRYYMARCSDIREIALLMGKDYERTRTKIQKMKRSEGLQL